MTNQLGLKLAGDIEKGTIPRLNRCYLCKTWALETNLKPIEIPDQGTGHVRKLACKQCLDRIMGGSGLQDASEGGENKK